jgi:zinc/manganese transport system substrate-binding protein
MSIGKQAAREKIHIKTMAVAFFATVCAGCTFSGLLDGRESTRIFSDGWIEGEALADPEDLSPINLSQDERLVVIATTSIVADVIANVGGSEISLATLIPAGIDPHAYEPKAGDYHRMADSHVVFISGAGLEAFISEALGQIAGDVPVVSLSRNLILRRYSEYDSIVEVDVKTATGGEDSHEHTNEVDPHVWLDPLNVVHWTENAADALIALDPRNADIYRDNAKQYIDELEELHAWSEARLAQIPEENRALVSDHRVFGYFIDRYGFEVVGSVVSAFSSAVASSARDLAELEDLIHERDVKVIFVGETTSRRLADQIAADTGIEVIMLYTGSLGQAGGEADTYIKFMEHNVRKIVRALER